MRLNELVARIEKAHDSCIYCAAPCAVVVYDREPVVVHSGDGCSEYLNRPGSYRTTLDEVIQVALSFGSDSDVGVAVAIAAESRDIAPEEPIPGIDTGSIPGIDTGSIPGIDTGRSP